MSKGTKQIRAGRITALLAELKRQAEAYEDAGLRGFGDGQAIAHGMHVAIRTLEDALGLGGDEE